MQALAPTDAPAIRSPLSADTTLNQSCDPDDLQWLGELLRVVYGPVEAPLPTRLAELAQRLARREQSGG